MTPPWFLLPGLDRRWLLDGVRAQIRFWTALELSLASPDGGAPAADESGPPKPAPVLVVAGSHADPELTGNFQLENPTAAALTPSFAIEPLRRGGGRGLFRRGVRDRPRDRRRSAATRRDAIAGPAHLPRRLPRPGRYRGRLTVRCPGPHHLGLELRIDP
jgi:hypothetical protein